MTADLLDAIAARPVAYQWENQGPYGEWDAVFSRWSPEQFGHKDSPHVRNLRGLIIGSDGVETERKRTGPAVTYGPGGNHGSMGPG